MNRRSFVTGAALLVAPPRVWAQPNLEREHRPQLDVRQIAEDPTAVPVAVSVDHPMDTDHFIRSIEVTLDNDPVPYKGTFLLGPANGRAAIAFKMRSGAGGQLKAVLECSRHGRFTATRAIRVVEGGCTTPPETTARERPRNPQIRLPEPIAPGQKEMLVFFDGQKITEFRLSPAVSPNPLIRFALKVTHPGALKVIFVNNEGQRAEVSQPVRF